MINKKQSYGTARWWLNGRKLSVRRYLQRFYPIHDWGVIKHFFMENPIQARIILNDFLQTNDNKLKEVVKLFVYGKSKIVYIVGARGSGKTAVAFLLAEETHKMTGRPIFYISPSVNKTALPEWCKTVENMQDAPNGCLAMIDEASLQFNAREFMKKENIDMTKLLAIARHKDMFLIFLTQDTSLADTNIRRLRDIILWKMANDYSLSERGNKNQREGKFYQKVRNMMSPRTVEECLFEYPSHRRFIHFNHSLPDCWSNELSKSWKMTKFREEKEKKIVKQIDERLVIPMPILKRNRERPIVYV